MGLVEIKITSVVSQYSTYDDGFTAYGAVKSELDKGNNIAISFEDIAGVPSSFVNGLLSDMIEELGINAIKKRVKFINSTRIINEMLKRKFTLAQSS